MDRRTLLALALMAAVIIITPMLFPSSRTANKAIRDTAAAGATAAPVTPATPATTTPTPTAQPTVSAAPGAAATTTTTTTRTAQPKVPAESVTVAGARATTILVNTGAVPAAVKITGFKSLRPGARDSSLTISQTHGPLLHYRLVTGRDTIALDTVNFAVAKSGNVTTFTSASPAMTLSYETSADGFQTAVRGNVANAPAGSLMLIDLPSNFRSAEADTLDDQRHHAYGYKIPLRDVESIPFSKLDANTVRSDTGSFQWVNARDKYWIIALMQPVPANVNPNNPPKGVGVFRGLVMRGGVRAGRVAPTASATTSYPMTNGQIAFDMYIGPQKYQNLRVFGNDLESSNPYAGFLKPVVQPFVTIVLRVVLWMKSTTALSYGWVLVIFGVVIRLLLWPLNQKAMRSSIAMQTLQPELQEVQKKYKNDPEKQRDALVKLYAAHGMSPLSPMLGCLPMLLPLPILYALYYVFQNTVEFRGVPFLWLPDLSLKDPYYIIPLVMGASMFLLSWIGMRSMPSNPQAKMMSYMMPVMFTVMFLNFASGLNLYYATQNLAALPQQWILTRERAKAAAKKQGGGASSATVKRRT
jgi:YidC/Oxa1 family membrane protein insertase